jgi:putative phage-type endonuclease
MNIVSLTQGSPEWLAHRAQHFNASDAPAMLGCSPYKSRRQLLREVKTGLTPEVDAAAQKRFNNGHRLEALARPLAEDVIGEPLYPVTGTNGRFSASFDGLTLAEDCVFEHKALNADLRAAFQTGADLPLHYRVQMEQQLLVSGAERVLFMASDWDGAGNLIEEHHRWYLPDHGLRSQIADGWGQFARDLETFEVEADAAPAVVGSSPDTLPALRIEVEGAVIASNLPAFRETALAAIRSVNRTLATDQDFADAELSVKWCRDVEERLEAQKRHALSQTASIEELFRTMDDIAAESRRVRLDLEKLVKGRKEEIRAAIVMDAQRALAKHLAALSAEVEPFIVSGVAADFAGAIKGKRSITAMHDAVDHALADAKIAADAAARVVRTNAAALHDLAAGRESLFPDAGRLVGMEPAAFREIVGGRLAKATAEAAEREKAATEAAIRLAAERARVEEEKRAAPRRAPVIEPATGAVLSEGDPEDDSETANEPATLSLGEINARLGITMSAAFVGGTLNVAPAGTNRRALLFTESQFAAVCRRLANHAQAVRMRHGVSLSAVGGDA